MKNALEAFPGGPVIKSLPMQGHMGSNSGLRGSHMQWSK